MADFFQILNISYRVGGVGSRQKMMTLSGPILQAGIRKIFSLAEIPRNIEGPKDTQAAKAFNLKKKLTCLLFHMDFQVIALQYFEEDRI